MTTKYMKKQITTNYTAQQKFYQLPHELYKDISVEVFNKKKKEWRKVSYVIWVEIVDRRLKTDETIKINY